MVNLIKSYRPNRDAFVALGLIVLLGMLVVAIVGSTGLARVNDLKIKLALQQQLNLQLGLENQVMSEEVARLSSDQQLLENYARYHYGLIRPGEVFVQLPN